MLLLSKDSCGQYMARSYTPSNGRYTNVPAQIKGRNLSEDEPEDGVDVVGAMEEGIDFFGDGSEVERGRWGFDQVLTLYHVYQVCQIGLS